MANLGTMKHCTVPFVNFVPVPPNSPIYTNGLVALYRSRIISATETGGLTHTHTKCSGLNERVRRSPHD